MHLLDNVEKALKILSRGIPREEEYSSFKIVPTTLSKGCDCDMYYRIYGYRGKEWHHLETAKNVTEAKKIVEHYKQKVIYIENKGA